MTCKRRLQLLMAGGDRNSTKMLFLRLKSSSRCAQLDRGVIEKATTRGSKLAAMSREEEQLFVADPDRYSVSLKGFDSRGGGWKWEVMTRWNKMEGTDEAQVVCG